MLGKQFETFNVVDVRIPNTILVAIEKGEKDKSTAQSMFTFSLLQL